MALVGRKFRLFSIVASSAVLVAFLGFNLQAGEDFNQNHLAKMLARVLGVEGRLPVAGPVDDYFTLLTTMGIAPLDGWRVDEPVTQSDLAVVMVQALGLQGEVEDTLDPEAYADVLKSEGISLKDGIANMDHAIAFPTVINSFDALQFGNTVADRFETSLSPIGTVEGF